jgi:hypothetical protein
MKRPISALVACLFVLGLMPSIASAAKDKGEVYIVDSAGVPMVPASRGGRASSGKPATTTSPSFR